MYKRDCIEIANLAKYQNSVAPIIGFTLSTIQAGLQTCTWQAEKVIKDKYKANCLWGLKAEGLEYAIKNDHVYLDYFSNLHDGNNGLMKKYGIDPVHPNKDGYIVMSKLLAQAIEESLTNKISTNVIDRFKQKVFKKRNKSTIFFVYKFCDFLYCFNFSQHLK